MINLDSLILDERGKTDIDERFIAEYAAKQVSETFNDLKAIDKKYDIKYDALEVDKKNRHKKHYDELIKERKEIYFNVSSKVTKNWSVSVYDRIDLTDGGGQLEHGGQLAYEDECLQLAFTAKRHNYKDPSLDNDYEFGINFFFKTLGGLGSK